MGFTLSALVCSDEAQGIAQHIAVPVSRFDYFKLRGIT